MTARSTTTTADRIALKARLATSRDLDTAMALMMNTVADGLDDARERQEASYRDLAIREGVAGKTALPALGRLLASLRRTYPGLHSRVVFEVGMVLLGDDHDVGLIALDRRRRTGRVVVAESET